MSASPADFELYSRATGYPVPSDPAERMRMAPAVHAFSQNYAKRPQTQRTPGIVSRSAGGLGKAALGALAIGGIAALAGSQRGEIPPDDGGGGGGGPTEPPTRVGQRGFVRIPEERAPQEEPRPVRQVRNVVIPPKRSDSQEKVRSVRTPQYTKEQYGNVVTEKPPKRDLAAEADAKVAKIRDPWINKGEKAPQEVSIIKAPSSEVVEPVEQANVEVVGNPLANIRSSWSNRTAAGPRIQVDESEWKPGAWSVEDTERSIFNPTGKRLVKNPVVVGKNPDGSPKYMQPKAALTGGDASLIPRQWPPAGRVNVGDAWAAMMARPGESGLGPVMDGITASFGPLGDIHVPGALQLANWGVPVVAGLGRKGLGDVMETADLAASGIGYVAKNLRPILKQGREDWSKGYRDIRTGVQDLGLVRDTANQLMLAAAMKRDQDLGLIEGGAQRVMTWAQKQRSLEGRPLSGTGQLEAGVEHDLRDNAQIDDPHQVHEQHQIPPSKGGWKQKHYGQEAAERRMRWDDIRDQKIADFVNQHGTRQEWAQAEMDQDIAEQDL